MKEKELKKERVLFIITKSNFGGAQRYVYELATSLNKQGFETAVALGGNGALKTKLEEAGITVFSVSDAQRDINIFKEFKVLWHIFTIMHEYKPHIVHLNSPKIGGLGALAARKASLFNRFVGPKEITNETGVKEKGRYPIKKIIYTNHGWPFKEPRPEWQLILIRTLSWLTVFLNQITIVLSQTEKDDVRNWPFINKKLVIIPNGLKPFPLKEKTEALITLVGKETAELWLRENWTIIGTISELHKNKGLPFAIEGVESYITHSNTEGDTPEIIEQRKKTAFVIIGEGEERKNIEALIAQKSLKNKVILAGTVDDARGCLSAFDLFLLSSVKEGLPFAILEAGFAGIPVISTSVGAIPEVIKNLETGLLIHPARPQQIKNALIYIEEHPEIKNIISTALKSHVAEKFNFEYIIEKVKELYTK